MNDGFIVKQRPVCANCGRQCGTKFREWLIEQPEASPWDGVSWFHKYNPFCTLRCALAYAKRAYAKHGAIT
jgi:hypothetical protein